MPTPDGKLDKGQQPMTDERWKENKVCELSNRSHKWRWVTPEGNVAICVHCGNRTILTRENIENDSP